MQNAVLNQAVGDTRCAGLQVSGIRPRPYIVSWIVNQSDLLEFDLGLSGLHATWDKPQHSRAFRPLDDLERPASEGLGRIYQRHARISVRSVRRSGFFDKLCFTTRVFTRTHFAAGILSFLCFV